MAQYIDKDALVAEIEKRITNIKEYCVRKGHDRRFDVVSEQLSQILAFINTLEVKEVDLEIEQRMKKCPYRKVGCTMYKDKVLECKGACCWVVDYLKLKELKVQKEEEV